MELWAANVCIVLALVLGLSLGHMVGYSRGYRKRSEMDRMERKRQRELDLQKSIAAQFRNAIQRKFGEIAFVIREFSGANGVDGFRLYAPTQNEHQDGPLLYIRIRVAEEANPILIQWWWGVGFSTRHCSTDQHEIKKEIADILLKLGLVLVPQAGNG